MGEVVIRPSVQQVCELHAENQQRIFRYPFGNGGGKIQIMRLENKHTSSKTGALCGVLGSICLLLGIGMIRYGFNFVNGELDRSQGWAIFWIPFSNVAFIFSTGGIFLVISFVLFLVFVFKW